MYSQGSLLDIQGQVVQNYLDRIPVDDQRIVASVDTEEGSLPKWLQEQICEKEREQFPGLSKQIFLLHCDDKDKFCDAIKKIESLNGDDDQANLEKEQIANNNVVFDGFRKLLRSLNLLEPKFLTEQSFDFSDGNHDNEK